ncbi:hypothetical protein SLA2020_369090 [Shorea laevis]
MAFVPIIRCLHIRCSNSSCLALSRWKGFRNRIRIPCAISDVFQTSAIEFSAMFAIDGAALESDMELE